MRFSNDLKDEILKNYNNDNNYKNIIEKYKISRSTFYRLLKKDMNNDDKNNDNIKLNRVKKDNNKNNDDKNKTNIINKLNKLFSKLDELEKENNKLKKEKEDLNIELQCFEVCYNDNIKFYNKLIRKYNLEEEEIGILNLENNNNYDNV